MTMTEILDALMAVDIDAELDAGNVAATVTRICHMGGCRAILVTGDERRHSDRIKVLARELVESLRRALLDDDWVADDDEVMESLDRVVTTIFSVDEGEDVRDDPWDELLIGPGGPGLA